MLVCLGSININTLHYIFLYKNLYKYGKERDQIFFLFALLSASFHPSISVIKKNYKYTECVGKRWMIFVRLKWTMTKVGGGNYDFLGDWKTNTQDQVYLLILDFFLSFFPFTSSCLLNLELQPWHDYASRFTKKLIRSAMKMVGSDVRSRYIGEFLIKPALFETKPLNETFL